VIGTRRRAHDLAREADLAPARVVFDLPPAAMTAICRPQQLPNTGRPASAASRSMAIWLVTANSLS
jgi:hypothetical protein